MHITIVYGRVPVLYVDTNLHRQLPTVSDEEYTFVPGLKPGNPVSIIDQWFTINAGYHSPTDAVYMNKDDITHGQTT